MFFYPTVLNHRTGRFATVWLAATKGRKITRRDVIKISVMRTCSSLMDYVLVRVPPPLAGLPQPRFSIYLSCQLQFGVIFVFSQQCSLMLDTLHGSIGKMHRSHVTKKIDMLPQDTRLTHTLPDHLILLNETECARDPFFGLMEFDLSSPSRTFQLAQMPEFSLEPPADLPIEGITASQESITMAEQDPTALPEPEFGGVELQDFDMAGMLLEQPDHFTEGDGQRVPEAARPEREPGREEDSLEREIERAVAERERTRELTGSLISLDLTRAQTTDALSRELDEAAEAELTLPAEKPALAEQEQTPEPIPIPPAPPSPERREPVGESPRPAERFVPPSPEVPVPAQIRRRRRQLAFFDAETQISQDALQAQINDPYFGTKSFDDLFIAPSRVSTPQVLLENPCMSLPPEILELWKQGAVLHHIPAPERRGEGRESGRERDRGRDGSEIGVLREIPTDSESGILRHDTPVSSLVMETTDRDISPLETPEIRRSPVRVSVSGLEDIPEERAPEIQEVSLRLPRVDEHEVTFHSLLPPTANRLDVSQAFWRLLERVKRKEAAVRQDEPYGDIIISPLRQPRQTATPVS